ncbi:hypothetical protein GQ53DRAFT_681163, partial [Thozetella sp. PMI_491]
MAFANPYISNGTCYYSPYLETVPAFLPCGNDAIEYHTCCQAGDMRLSSKACYNWDTGVTYLAGCSDPKYTDSSCPNKQNFPG